MKRFLKYCLLGSLFSCFALASESVWASQYISCKIGPDYPYWTNGTSHGQKVGASIGISYGYMISEHFRSELEMSYRNADRRNVYEFDDNNEIISKKRECSHAMSYMINGIYDIHQASYLEVIPYVGAGIGWCRNKDDVKIKYDVESFESTRRDNRLSLQLIVGIKYPVYESIDSIIEYKYITAKEHVKNHCVHFGVLARF